jgi:hypothetical protein
MKRPQLSLDRTRQLHQQIVESAVRDPQRACRALAVANRELADRRLTFGHVKPLEAALTALLLNKDDLQLLTRAAESLHAVIEKVLDFVTETPERLQRFFPEHERVFPYLAKTAGCRTWQVVARYDMAVTGAGELKLLELNTSCPGGFMISQAMSEVTRHGLVELGAPLDETLTRWSRNATVHAETLADELLALETAAGVQPEAIAVLNDENDLIFELDLVADSLRRHNRQVVIANAADLRLKGEQLRYNDQAVSLTYNKFRVSTRSSPHHCWRDGFAQRYAAFLAAQQNGRVVSVNNLGGMSLAEDKSFLAVFANPEVRDLLSADEQLILDEHLLWTARLEEGPVVFDGRAVDLMPYVRTHRDEFVIKPANEGRGFGVVVGKYASEPEWTAACIVDPSLPKVVQQFTESVTLPVVCPPREAAIHPPGARVGGTTASGEPLVQEMFVTLGLTLIRGRYRGLVSRVSANPVTNVAREGFGQAAFVRA